MRQPSSYLSTSERPASGLGRGDQLGLSTGHIPVSTFFEDENSEDEYEKELEDGMANEGESDKSKETSNEYKGVRSIYLVNRRVKVDPALPYVYSCRMRAS